MKEVTLLAPLAPLRTRVRLVKITEILLDNNIHVSFRGWERSPGDLKENTWADEIDEKAILTGGGNGKRSRIMYPLWMLCVFVWVLIIGRNKTIYCLGWETAFPASIAAVFSKSTIVFDDADRFSLVIKMPKWLKRLVQVLEKWTSRQAFMHIIPTKSRYDWYINNMIVLKNTPALKDYNLIPHDHHNDSNNSKLTVFINGWVGQTRGASIFLQAISNIRTKYIRNIEVIIAGRVDSDEGKRLIEHPIVTFYGMLPQVKALELYAKSDLVLTYYDPSIEINRLAESNKWGDCVYFGVPFVVNKEVRTARTFIEHGAAFALPYTDSKSLTNLLERLTYDKAALAGASDAIRNMQHFYPYFDRAFEDNVLTRLF